MSKIKDGMSKIGNNVQALPGKIKEKSPVLFVILEGILAIIIIVIIVYVIKYFIKKYEENKHPNPWVLKGTKNARKKMIVLQDPNSRSAITLKRSSNQLDGLEFSYIFWIYVDNYNDGYGRWKHVLHKGNKTAWPLRCPGVWLHPKKNSLRVYVNTFKKVNSFIDIDNIPVHKWFCVTVAVKQKQLDVYINRNLAKSKQFESMIRQNYGDLYINAFKGFSGYMSNIRYFSKYISFAEINDHLKRGPAIIPCVDTLEMPPYLAANWWSDK